MQSSFNTRWINRRRALHYVFWIAVAAVASLSGCASLPTHVERPASTAIQPSRDTLLGRIADDSTPEEGQSGFRLLPVGSFALNTRLTLADRAEKTLDLQYYLIADDDTGRFLLRKLRDASVRGVRVRLLIDDLYTSGEDELLSGLAAYPNVEVRLFNPFPGGRGDILTRFAASAFDIPRLNHRMHNKLFIADGVMAVAGGRNIADEYFMRSLTENFVDLDSFMTGAIVPQLSDIFDEYWNSQFVYPLQSIVKPDESPQVLREHFEAMTGPEHTKSPEPLPPNDTLGYGPLSDDLNAGQLGLTWALAFAYADLPSKISMVGGDMQMDTVQYNVISLMRSAQKEVLISSPYMIPGKEGMSMMHDDRQRGVQIKILTNSLGATDEPVVHIGYSHYRHKMLEEGVELYELSATRVRTNMRLGMFGTSIGRLHAKIAVIDRQTLFVGSMNFDPRSAHKNTELGVIIESGPLAREVVKLMDIARFQSSYRLRLAKSSGDIEWLSTDGDTEQVMTVEPDASPWLKFELDLLAPFAPEELL